MFNDLKERLAERRMKLQVSPQARQHIAQAGFDPVYGARPLRRYIAREVETRIGRALLTGQIHDGATIEVELDEHGQLVVRHENPPDDG
jgi:ATP-dependent Clp protease ATP-binding subunit ClpB